MSRYVSCALLILLQSACRADADTTPPSFSVTDSAGIAIVDNQRAAWTPTTAWRLTESPVISVEPDPDNVDEFLSGVRGPVQLSNGSLVIVDAGSAQLRFYDQNGALQSRAGRRGAGPGEFDGFIGPIFRCAGDTLLVSQRERLSVWTASGTFVRSQPITSPADGWVGSTIQAVAPDCQSVLLQENNPRVPPNDPLPRAEVRLVWHSISTGDRRTVVTYGGRQGVQVSWMGRTFTTLIPWSAVPVLATADTVVVYGLADQPEYRVVRPDGSLTRIVRWVSEPAPVTSDDRRSFEQSRSDNLKKYPEEVASNPPLELLKVPANKPVYLRLQVDDARNVWIREYTDFDAGYAGAGRSTSVDTPVSWRVFNESGQLLGNVQVPAGVEVRKITRDALLGVHYDADDVQTIRVYGIVKP